MSPSQIRSRGLSHFRGRRAFRQPRLPSKLPSAQPTAVPQKTTEVEAPEPRPNSTEWWRRENVRVGKAIIICRVCFAQAAPGVAAPTKGPPTELSANRTQMTP